MGVILLAHPQGDEFLLPFARLLASVCKLPGQSQPRLTFCGPENQTIIFFPSIIQRAEVWGSCQGSASRGCNKMCGSLLRRGCFSSYKSIHTSPQPPGDRQFTPWQAFRVGVQLKQSDSLVAPKSHISPSALKWSEFRMGSRLFSKSLSPFLPPEMGVFPTSYDS